MMGQLLAANIYYNPNEENSKMEIELNCDMQNL
jgi:hypothetical protein